LPGFRELPIIRDPGECEPCALGPRINLSRCGRLKRFSFRSSQPQPASVDGRLRSGNRFRAACSSASDHLGWVDRFRAFRLREPVLGPAAESLDPSSWLPRQSASASAVDPGGQGRRYSTFVVQWQLAVVVRKQHPIACLTQVVKGVIGRRRTRFDTTRARWGFLPARMLVGR
jgi:hypothetical protein